MLHFKIAKPFVELELYPSDKGLKISYHPTISGTPVSYGNHFCELEISISQVGQFWAAVKTLIQSNAFVNLQLLVKTSFSPHELKLKLYREHDDSSTHTYRTWLQIVDSPQARRIRKIQLDLENLHNLELACHTAMTIGVAQLQHLQQAAPTPAAKSKSALTLLPACITR